MAKVELGFRITGADEAVSRANRLGPAALSKIASKARSRAKITIAKFKAGMALEYRSQWATGRLADSIKEDVKVEDGGVSVQFKIKDYRELEYVTATGGGYFQDFPVGPYWISPINAKALAIPLPGSKARRFIQLASGRLAGSRAGTSIIVRHPVRWGKKTGGFRHDVISEVAEEEGENFMADMEEAVSNAIVEVTT